MHETDVIIIGAGAAGLMCAIEAAKRHRHVLIIDHANKPGKKILMSGGGRCNFTNLRVSPEKYLSQNPHFCKSALSRYTQWDFIELVKKYQVPFHEKTLGQLFCDDKSKDIVNLLLSECENAGVTINLEEKIYSIEQQSSYRFKIITSKQVYRCESLVIATGGLSIPTMGATAFGYEVAKQFDIPVLPVKASLVPLTLHEHDKERFAPLSGIANHCAISNNHMTFHESLLFTHRGLSGPCVLQISNYWQPGETLNIDLLPNHSLFDLLKTAQIAHPKRSLKEYLGEHFAKRIVNSFIPIDLGQMPLQSIGHRQFQEVAQHFHRWQVKPNGTEGYRTAEVTLGGVDTKELSSKTMAANNVAGLYFIGEVVDVTGWLGGYNFQWAWSSGWAAGQVV
ncbi:aminoacetone oxidase family FAD-binding enzyme [Candidatus Berkiella aquae]|uniref:NAD(P)/FAD-dependent oxidoreductase n=1 Tax=Candidatus Berkiella aquae TaxID=295108 RepID=A0A0Q9YWS5_9GAMM|nr:NAD(P)/FAD-dependent oxidoreductase [Candidatus Berkiella aquae]MCS5710187.1 NAD(P)/FAD-dependent oxidoreductase [Candidatus Berkiella aquae]